MEMQRVCQVTFHLARVGFHAGPTWETRIYKPCADKKEAMQRIREEFPESEWDIWDVSFSQKYQYER